MSGNNLQHRGPTFFSTKVTSRSKVFQLFLQIQDFSLPFPPPLSFSLRFFANLRGTFLMTQTLDVASDEKGHPKIPKNRGDWEFEMSGHPLPKQKKKNRKKKHFACPPLVLRSISRCARPKSKMETDRLLVNDVSKPKTVLPVSFTFRDLHYHIEKKKLFRPTEKAHLLKGVSGTTQPGTVLAIMGPSGSSPFILIHSFIPFHCFVSTFLTFFFFFFWKVLERPHCSTFLQEEPPRAKSLVVSMSMANLAT